MSVSETPRLRFGTIDTGAVVSSEKPFIFLIRNDSALVEQFRLVISGQNGKKWTRTFELPVRPDVPEFKDFVVADGRTFTVAAAGNDSASLFLGKGNGDGIANPGESVVILVKDHGIYHRTEILVNDPWINPHGVKIRKSDNWGSYDHVGASEKYSVPLLASETPEGHVAEMLATYWLPDYPYHIITRGIVRLPVRGKDTTPPVVREAGVSGDNTIHAWLFDGGKIGRVEAKLIRDDDQANSWDEPLDKSKGEKSFIVALNDDGLNGDRVANDFRFSATVNPTEFGLYRLTLEVTDAEGNSSEIRVPGLFPMH